VIGIAAHLDVVLHVRHLTVMPRSQPSAQALRVVSQRLSPRDTHARKPQFEGQPLDVLARRSLIH
jgi:hypothetical protein